jgi:hypothetical protein
MNVLVPNPIVINAPELLANLEETPSTIVHCTYYSSPLYRNGGWVHISKTTYLQHPLSKEKVQLLHALNIPLAPSKHYFTRCGEYFPFTLIFPKLPTDWLTFDLVEVAAAGGFCVKNISRNESGIYRVSID